MSLIPDNLWYTKNHIWLRLEDDFTGVCGLTDHAQERLDEIIYVDIIDKGLEVRQDEIVATLESFSDVREIPSPVNGEIIDINSSLEGSPGLINRDPYGEGWIFKIDVKYKVELDELMDNHEYEEYIQWE